MTSRQLDEERIFHVAREIGNSAARDDYLDEICAGDQALRARVEAVLEVHEKEQSFLKSSQEPAPTVDHTLVAERPGATIGRFKLIEQLGEGGMGTVFVGQQERPIRRKVAITVIKPGMAYRCKKFARRNRVAIFASTLVFTLLIIGVAITSWMAHRANQTLEMLAEASYKKAVSDALFSDQESALTALKIAERTGCSESRILVIHGLMEINSGKYDDAVLLAREAIKDDSFSEDTAGIGAYAVLAIACLWAGYDDLWGSELARLRSLKPHSDTDYLLQAYVFAMYEPTEAIPLLKARPRVEHSPVGLAIRGWHRVFTATDKQDPVLLDEAVQDFKYAQFLLRNAQGPIAWRTWTLVSAIDLAQRNNAHEDEQRYTTDGQELVKKLANFAEYPSGDFCRWMYWLTVGEEEEAWQAIRRVGQHRGSYSWFLAADCRRSNSGPVALAEFDNAVDENYRTSKYVRIARVHLLCDVPGSSLEADKAVRDLINDSSPYIQRHSLTALCLTGYPGIVKVLAKAVLAKNTTTDDPGDLWMGDGYLRYLAEDLSDVQLLDVTRRHRGTTAAAHYTIAMKHLGEGRRDRAITHFEKAMATNTIGGFDYEWSRAYLSRLRADATWPTRDAADQ